MGQTVDRDEVLASWSTSSTSGTTSSFSRASSASAAIASRSGRPTRNSPCAIEFWGDEVEQLSIINPTSGEVIERHEELFIYPSKHFVLPEERIAGGRRRDQARAGRAAGTRCIATGKLLEAQRLNARTRFDIEMMQEVGYCPGIENYSRPLSGRPPGSPPDTLFSFFPDDFLLFVDESHVTVPQVRGMYRRRPQPQGDAGRARLPPAQRAGQPAAAVRGMGAGRIKQVILRLGHAGPLRAGKDRRRSRRAGDPAHRACWTRRSKSPRPAAQVPHLLEQIRERAAAGERVLVTTLTKRLAEDLSAYFSKQDVRCKWLHSELDAFERVELLRDLRAGPFRRAGGREPAARRARPARGLAGGHPRRRQGRLPAQRNLADADHRPLGPQRQRQGDAVCRQGDRLDAAGDRRDPPPPRDAAGRTTREHGITPETIRKAIRAGIEAEAAAHAKANAAVGRGDEAQYITEEYLAELEAEMLAAAEALEFERAAALRDRIEQMRNSVGKEIAEVDFKTDDQQGKGRGRRKGGRHIPRPKRP